MRSEFTNLHFRPGPNLSRKSILTTPQRPKKIPSLRLTFCFNLSLSLYLDQFSFFTHPTSQTASQFHTISSPTADLQHRTKIRAPCHLTHYHQRRYLLQTPTQRPTKHLLTTDTRMEAPTSTVLPHQPLNDSPFQTKQHRSIHHIRPEPK